MLLLLLLLLLQLQMNSSMFTTMIMIYGTIYGETADATNACSFLLLLTLPLLFHFVILPSLYFIYYFSKCQSVSVVSFRYFGGGGGSVILLLFLLFLFLFWFFLFVIHLRLHLQYWCCSSTCTLTSSSVYFVKHLGEYVIKMVLIEIT